MTAEFVELRNFARRRDKYLSDDSFAALQRMLMANPEVGDTIKGTGGLRKVRFADRRRSKGKRGGLRIIYYWWSGGSQFWLFTVYDKNEQADLTPADREALAALLKQALRNRTSQ